MLVEILSYMPFLLIFFIKKEYSCRSFVLRLFIPVSYLVLWLSSFFVEDIDANKMLAASLAQTIYFISFMFALLHLRNEHDKYQNITKSDENITITALSFLITFTLVGLLVMLLTPFSDFLRLFYMPKIFRESFAFSFGLQLPITFINIFRLELKERGFKWLHPIKNAKKFGAVTQDFKISMLYDGSKVKISKLIALIIGVPLYTLVLALLAISLYII